MGYYLTRSAADLQPLASITGLGDLRRWVEMLPPDDSKNLRHLFAFGWSGEQAALRKELAGGLKSHPPKPDVLTTAENLARLLEGDVADGVVTITDGLGPE